MIDMKYAIASSGNKAESLVSAQFGHAAYVAIYETDTQELQFVENPYSAMRQQAGKQLLEMLLAEHVHFIVSGSFGPKIIPLIGSRKVQLIVYDRKGTSVEHILHLINNKKS